MLPKKPRIIEANRRTFRMTEELKQGSRLGNYELLLRVGRGGMATVWVARERARASRDDRLVAVKVMLTELADESEFIKMFLDEVRLVRSIRHPNVVDVYDVGEHEGMMWMAMEWVEGESLHTVIAEAGKRRAIPPGWRFASSPMQRPGCTRLTSCATWTAARAASCIAISRRTTS